VIGLAALAAGVLFATGVYLMLSRNVQRLLIGFVLLSNGANLLVITAAGLPEGASPPLLSEGQTGPFADPLAQAFLLTAIVIGLGMTAFLAALAIRAHRETGSVDLDAEREP
jgi:multicomponent Na+:H+ antiporter subunit C